MEFMPYLATAVSIAALLVAAATFVRAGRWREAEKLDQLEGRVGAHDKRITEVEATQRNLATKADITKLTAEIDGLEKLVKSEMDGVRRSGDATEQAVIRIERLLMGEK